MKYYAGIGSRETPLEVQTKMTEIAKRLSRLSYCLRSGGADGADTAFALGTSENTRQIFLPWDGFNGLKSNGRDYTVPPFREETVLKYHPKPSSLSRGAWQLMSRNANQILGTNLDDPVEFVLCWTKDGKASGGTGQTMRIAADHEIPIFNFRNGFDDFATYMNMKILVDM
jgi:hypothetical protein